MQTILHVDSPEFDDAKWQEYHALMIDIKKRYKAMFPRSTWSEFRDRVSSFVNGEPGVHRYVVIDGSEMTGWGEMRVRNPGTPEQAAYFAYDCNRDQVSPEFAETVARESIRLMERYESQTANSMITNKRNTELLHMWGARVLSRCDRYLLPRDKANYHLINEWLKQIPAENPEVHIEFCTEIPDEHLDRYAELFNQFINEMPQEHEGKVPASMDGAEIRRRDVWRKKNNTYLYTCLLLDRDERLIGHSNAFINGTDPIDVYQAMTGVISEYRGRGLAKWLKGALFVKVGEAFPANKQFTTEMRAVNEPIQAVNSRMGYELFSQGNEFEVSLECLKEYCARA